MRKQMALAVLMLFSPGLAWAQSAPENVLPSRSQLYFRWDGVKAHREEFDRTAFGKTLKGDTGKFLSELWIYATENIESAINQGNPEAAGIFKDVIKALGEITDGGVALGVELEKVNPPKANAVLVFPGTATETGKLLPLIQKAADSSRAEIKNTTVGRRRIHAIDISDGKGVYLGWWNEGSDTVVMLGTEEPGEYAKAVEAKKTGLAKNPLYKKVQGFKEFTTGARAYIDINGIVGAVEDASPEAAKLVDALGVRGLKNITYVSGYQGEAFRGVVEVDMPGPRNGLLALTSSKKFTLKDLPPLPTDMTSLSASSIDVSKAYDVLLPVIEAGVRIFAPDKVDEIRDQIKAIQDLVGVNFKDDIFGCFGDMAVTYTSPAEGPLSFFGTTLIKVKDGKRLMTSIDKIVKSIPNQGFEISLKKKTYRDVEMNDLYFKVEQFSMRIGSFAVYKEWFIFSPYPQGIKGFVLRNSGDLPRWKADAELTKILSQFPQEFVGIQVSDPRRTIQTALSLTPLVIDLLNQITNVVPINLRPFDVDLVPHAQEATRFLFPSVTVTTDDGKRIRSESRSSIGLP
jgi:hypothetical protein